jgi:hypothetical protein
MPNYVAAKGYYRRILGDALDDVAYVIPRTPYEYDHPEGTGHEIPPFESMWFCCVGRDRIPTLMERWNNDNDDDDVVLVRQQQQKIRKTTLSSKEHQCGTPRLVPSLDGLVSLGVISMQNRPNPRQRKKKKRRNDADVVLRTDERQNAGGGGILIPTPVGPSQRGQPQHSRPSSEPPTFSTMSTRPKMMERRPLSKKKKKTKGNGSGSRHRDESGKRSRERF